MFYCFIRPPLQIKIQNTSSLICSSPSQYTVLSKCTGQKTRRVILMPNDFYHQVNLGNMILILHGPESYNPTYLSLEVKLTSHSGMLFLLWLLLWYYWTAPSLVRKLGQPEWYLQPLGTYTKMYYSTWFCQRFPAWRFCCFPVDDCVFLSLKSILCQSLIDVRNFSKHLCQETRTKIYLQLKYYKCVVLECLLGHLRIIAI